ncbi:MAG: 4-hydroxythreonine-4-phosphate dehydrogenase PdxA [Gammaproteobacteria bacterium]|nr:4-hydroxythreonine-4-phosphate dehydrogenase PdxA [Gammaproteobacteria bacterium]
MTPIALCSGEPAGIGPDLCIRMAVAGMPVAATVLGDPDVIAARAATLGSEVRIVTTGTPQAGAPGELHVTPVRARARVSPGVLDPANAPYVLEILDTAIDGCMAGTYAGVCTAPLHKGVINDAGIPFTGHTEYLAARTDAEQVVMMLAAGRLRVALATTHLPLRAVPDAITEERLRSVLRVLHAELRDRFDLPQPRILVLGLNPHAGEGGHLGHEDGEIIAPVIDALTAEGMKLSGPLPADTAFTPRWLEQADAVLAMYHDQGLPVLKHAGFGGAVNITLGLPIIRTSVDHGTALELAGSGRAEEGSLRAALLLAAEMAANRDTA